MSIQIVDPNSAIPKYFQLVNILRHKIEDGEWAAHEAIPSERALEKIFYISRITIREAISILIRQGYLYREHGKGTFVSPQKLQKPIQKLTSFSEDMINRGMTPGQIILSLEIARPPERISHILELTADQKVQCLRRIRLANNKPMGLETSYLTLPDREIVTRNELEETGSLYNILKTRFNIIPTEADEKIEATLASDDEARMLETAPGSPLLLTSRVMWSQNRRPVEFVKILYRGDRYSYTARLKV
jgi:GntR family transcriptional regulator